MSNKKKYFYKVSLGFVGCDQTGLIETDKSSDYIDGYLREQAIDNASSYGYEQDSDHFEGDCDQVGKDWDEDEEDYLSQGELEYWFEDYDPEEHDGSVYCVEFEEI